MPVIILLMIVAAIAWTSDDMEPIDDTSVPYTYPVPNYSNYNGNYKDDE